MLCSQTTTGTPLHPSSHHFMLWSHVCVSLVPEVLKGGAVPYSSSFLHPSSPPTYSLQMINSSLIDESIGSYWINNYMMNYVVQLNYSVTFDCLWPHGLQHARLPCPSPTAGACSNSCPSQRWCRSPILHSVIPFSSCLQSFPASGSFPVSQLFASGGQSIRALASISVLPMNIQDWFPLGWLVGWTVKQPLKICSGFPGGSVAKNPPAMQEMQVASVGWEDPLEEGMATDSSILTWRIPWTEKSGRLYIVHRAAKSQTQLKPLSMHIHKNCSLGVYNNIWEWSSMLNILKETKLYLYYRGQ